MADRLEDVIAGHVAAVVAAINNAQIYTAKGSPVGNGWPDIEVIKRATKAEGYVIGIVPVEPSRMTPRGNVVRTVPQKNPMTLTVDVADSVVTFGGAMASGVGVHLFLGDPGQPVIDVSLVTAAGESLQAFAARLNAAANNSSLLNVSTTVSGPSVTVSGSSIVKCKIADNASAALRVNSITQRLQLTMWASNGSLRGQVTDAIIRSIGTLEQEAHWIPIGDGTFAYTRYVSGPRRANEKVEDMSLKRADIMFDTSYDVLKPITLTRIVAIPQTTVADDVTQSQLIYEVPNG